MCLPKGFVRIRHFGFPRPPAAGYSLAPVLFKYSVPFSPSHTEPESLPLPRKPTPLLALVPNVAARMVVIERLTAAQIQLRSSALSRRSRRMIRPFRSPLTRCLSPPAAPRAPFLAPKPAPHFKPHLEFSPPTPRKTTTTHPILPLPPVVKFLSLFPKAFLINPNNHSICISGLPHRRLPSKQLYRNAPPARTPRTYLPSWNGRIRYSTSVF